jgi:L-asparagine transporter-like permease
MKNVWLFICLLMLVYSSGIKVSFSPFSLKFDNWVLVLGIILIMGGVVLISVHFYQKASDEVLDKVMEIIESQKNELKT